MKRILSSILVLAMLLTMIPSVFAATTDYTIDLGAASYEVAPGGTVEIPVYVKNNNGTGTDLGIFQISVVPPAGFTATAVGSTNVKDSDLTVHPTTQAVGYYNDSGISFTNAEAIFTITLTAPAAEGTYNVTYDKDNTLLYDAENYDEITSVSLVGAEIVVKSTTQPPVEDDEEITSDKDYMINLGKKAYTVAPGAAVEVPVYVVNNNGTGTDLGIFQISVVPPAGFTATAVGSTNVKDSDLTVHPTTQAVGYYNDSGISFTNAEAIFTITLTAPTAEGTYNVTYDKDNTLLYDAENYDEITSVDLIGATITVGNGGSVEPEPVVLKSIEVDPTAITVPYANQTDILGYVKGAIKSVTGTYSDDTTAAVAEYTVTVDGTTATVAVGEIKATIALSLEPAPVVLESIVVDPTEITVPYDNQNDIKGYVEGAIKSVTGTYSDDTTAAVAEYTVTVDGTTATVAVGEIKTTIALTLEPAPQPPVEDDEITSDKDYMINLGKKAYTVAPGATVEVPVYVVNNNGAGTDLGIFQISVVPPAGFTATAVGSTNVKDSDLTVHPTTQAVGYYNDSGISFTNAEAIFTITLTAPAAEGTYNVTYDKDNTLLYDAENYDEITSVDLIGATITVGNGGSVEPPVDEPEPSIVVGPTALEIPYGTEDVAAYIKNNVKVTYYADVDEDGVEVTDFAVTEDGVVTYNGLTANVAITKVTVANIAVDVQAITVPYGKDAKEYAEAEAAKAVVTATFSNNTTGTVVADSIAYANDVVTITVDGAEATIPVTVITAASLKIPADIVVDFGADVAEFIKNNIVVKVVLSDNTEIDPTTEVVVTDNGDNTATVAADGVEATINYTIGADPSALASIEITTEGPVVVPYGAEVAKYIAANIKVNGTTNGGDTVDVSITEANVTPEDGTATIDVNGLTDTIAYEVEVITGIEVAEAALDLAWDADVEAAVKAVKVYYVYSANTAKSEVPAEEIAYEISDTEAVITVGEFSATIALNIAEMPKYEVEEVAPVYALDGHKALVITMNVDGVPYVDGVAAVKVADKKFVYVTDAAQYAIEVKEEEAEIVAWGRLHRDDTATALDALIALNASAGKIADELKADDNAYIKADVVFDYEITSADALAINNISLGKAVVASVAE